MRTVDSKEKVAVGGHSYGAFMVANLLTHSNLACGIARSGAYNRTLTPLAFSQSSAITGRYLKFTIPCLHL
jgi:dipeptidyl aminopeptidase/acylaminoacyl peptidase